MSISRYFLLIFLILLLGFSILSIIGCDDDDDDDDDGAPSDDDSADDDDMADDDDEADDDDDSDDDDDDVVDDDDDDNGPSTEDCEPYGYTLSPNIIRGPYLQHVTKNTIRILWQTDEPGNTIVRFGPDENLGFFQCDLESDTHHEIEIEHLSTDTAYFYQVRSDGAESAPYTFSTAVDEVSPFTYVIYGDSRSIPANHAMVADGIYAQSPDFVFNVGDVVGDGWVYEQYDPQHFEPTEELMANIPMYVSIGNHEGESPHFYKLFSFPGNEKYFTFDYGNARFISINTNRLYIQGSPQYIWLESELQRAVDEGVEWIFTFAHHPAWSEGWDSPGYYGEILMRVTVIPLMEQYGVDVFFAGHTHDYERGFRNGMYQIITGGGGASLDSWYVDFPHVTVFESRHHFVLAEIEGKTATFTAMDPDGTVFDTWQINH